MAYRLAFRLGIWNVRQWLKEISAVQLMEWVAFHELEPFGEDREDARFGSVVQTLRETNRDRKKRTKPITLDESILTGGDLHTELKKPEKKDWRALKFIMSMWRGVVPGSTGNPDQGEK